MKRLLGLFTVAAFLLAIPASHFVWGKAHVPIDKRQVCHKGKVITISKNAAQTHIKGHGDCRLPACDFNNVFRTGDPCNSNNPGGKCNLPNPRSTPEVCGTRPACPAGPGCF